VRVGPGAEALLVGVVAFALRVALIVAVPSLYAFDAWQRWAGRGHLRVQDWMPATQALIALSDALGLGAVGARVLVAAAAAAGLGAAHALVRAWAPDAPRRLVLGGALALAAFGPLLTWTATLYQEGPFLLAVLGPLALWARAAAAPPGTPAPPVWPADLLFGLAPLARTEGWPLLLVWVALRLWETRRWTPLLAGWGAAAWLGGAALGWPARHAASPIRYDDWDGLTRRFDLGHYAGSLLRLGEHALASGSWVWALLLVAGLPGLRGLPSRGPAVFLGLALAGQLAATAFWLAGLEAATVRMQALPAAFAAVLGLAGLARSRARAPRLATAFGLGALGFAVYGAQDALSDARRSAALARPERALSAEIAACAPGCFPIVRPRRGLGTRDRHDGCEILQGVSPFLHGRDFWCAPWAADGARPPRAPTHTARFRAGRYDWAEGDVSPSMSGDGGAAAPP
jgi:hypothetical protein